jgi:hypothetical protein
MIPPLHAKSHPLWRDPTPFGHDSTPFRHDFTPFLPESTTFKTVIHPPHKKDTLICLVRILYRILVVDAGKHTKRYYCHVGVYMELTEVLFRDWSLFTPSPLLDILNRNKPARRETRGVTFTCILSTCVHTLEFLKHAV